VATSVGARCYSQRGLTWLYDLPKYKFGPAAILVARERLAMERSYSSTKGSRVTSVGTDSNGNLSDADRRPRHS